MAANRAKRGGRPKGSTGAPMDARIARLVDREIAKQLKGSPAFDPSTGRPILDAQGRPVLRPPTASLLAVAVKRARPIQPSTGHSDDPADSLTSLMAEMARETDLTPLPGSPAHGNGR